MTTDIRPTLSAQDSPTCSGEACPAFTEIANGTGTCAKMAHRDLDMWAGLDCIPGLRRLLATRTEDLARWRSDFQALAVVEKEVREERDAARRELSISHAIVRPPSQTMPATDYAASRGWSYLYAPAPPATGTEEGGDSGR